MNVKAGDRARIVRTGTVNDGAIVRVVEFAVLESFLFRADVWSIRGEKLLGFNLEDRIPRCVVSVALCRDQCLEPIRDDETPVDTREPVDIEEPETAAVVGQKAVAEALT